MMTIFIIFVIYSLLLQVLNNAFLDIQSVATYEKQMAAGFNSPDNDWTIFCTACPTQYRIFEWNFATQGQGDSFLDVADGVLDEGVFVGGKGYKLTNFSTGQAAEISFPLEQSWVIRAVAFNMTVAPASRVLALRPVSRSSASQTTLNPSNGVTYNTCRDALNATNFAELHFRGTQSVQTADVYIDKMAIIFEAYAAKPGSKITLVNTLCD